MQLQVPDLRRNVAPLLAVGGVVVGGLVAAAWGRVIVAGDPLIHVNAPPLVGTWVRTEPNVRFWAPVLVAAVVIAFGPVAARRLNWVVLTLSTATAGLVWAVSLAVTDGWPRLWSPLTSKYEYLAAVPAVEAAGGTGAFLRTFVDRLSTYPTHVRGHPPGLVVAFQGLDAVGLGGPRWAAAMVLTMAASGSVAVLLTVRSVAGAATARRLAPFLVLVPAAVWTATSGDALFAGVGCWAVLVGVLATSPSASPLRTRSLLAVAGVLFAVLALLSYGLVLLALIPMAVAAHRRRVAAMIAVGGVALAVLVVVGATTGFWWSEGLMATRAQQLAGVAPRRPYGYFVFGNLAALAVAGGPAMVGGLALVRRQAEAVLVAGAAAVIAVADLSGLSKGEVERIWLPFVPWLVVAAAALPRSRPWLTASAVLAISVQLCLRTPW